MNSHSCTLWGHQGGLKSFQLTLTNEKPLSHRTQQLKCTTYRPPFTVPAFVLPQDFVCTETGHLASSLFSQHPTSKQWIWWVSVTWLNLEKKGVLFWPMLLCFLTSHRIKGCPVGLIHFTREQYKSTCTILDTYLVSQTDYILATGQIFPPTQAKV